MEEQLAQPASDSRYMETLQLAGRIIMENGGETYRVEETITRMGRAFGLSEVESFAVPSGVFISYRKQDGSMESGVLRTHKGSTHLMRVDEVNTVSRQVEAHALTCEAACARLREIEHAHSAYEGGWRYAAAAICGGGFTLMFGGDAVDFASSAVVTALVLLLSAGFERLRAQTFVSVLLGSLATALLPLALHRMTGLGHTQEIIAGALMPLLPGLSMTNAIQDTMRGDMLSGLCSGLSAILTAALIAGGALMAVGLLGAWAGGGV